MRIIKNTVLGTLAGLIFVSLVGCENRCYLNRNSRANSVSACDQISTDGRGLTYPKDKTLKRDSLKTTYSNYP
jgi:hypothetical protein